MLKFRNTDYIQVKQFVSFNHARFRTSNILLALLINLYGSLRHVKYITKNYFGIIVMKYLI